MIKGYTGILECAESCFSCCNAISGSETDHMSTQVVNNGY